MIEVAVAPLGDPLEVGTLYGVIEHRVIAVSNTPQDGDDSVHIIRHRPAKRVATTVPYRAEALRNCREGWLHGHQRKSGCDGRRRAPR